MQDSWTEGLFCSLKKGLSQKELIFTGFVLSILIADYCLIEDVYHVVLYCYLTKKKTVNVFCFLHQPNTDERCEGTDVCRRSSLPLGRLAEEEPQRRPAAAEVDHEGTDVHSISTQTLTESHVSGVHEQPFPHIKDEVPPDASPALLAPTCRLEPRGGSPKFITLLAPLAVGSSHASQAIGGVRRSVNVNTDVSCDHERPCIRWPTSGGIHVKPSEGEASTRIKEGTIEDVPPVGHLDWDSAQGFFTGRKTTIENISTFSRELTNLAVVPGDRLVISEEKRLAVLTLDIDDPFVSSPLPTSIKPEKRGKANKMPHKTQKSTTESKARSKKDKQVGHYCGPQTSKKEDPLLHHVSAQQVCKQKESQTVSDDKCSSKSGHARCEDKEVQPVTENAEKASNKSHGKKKKKHAQHAAGARSVGEPPADVENGAKPKTTTGRVDMFEAKLSSRAGSTQKDSDHSCHAERKSLNPEAKTSKVQPLHHTGHKDHQAKSFGSPLNDEIKRRRLSGDKFGKAISALEPKLPKPAPPHQEKREEIKAEGGAPKKAYSEVVKQKTPPREGKTYI